MQGGVGMMLGLEDPWVAAAYLLSIASALLCLIFGLVNWNRGNEPARREDIQWAREEKENVESTL
jgi:heme A synthase